MLDLTPDHARCRLKGGVDYPMFLVALGIHYVPGLDSWVYFDRDSGDLHWENVLGEFVGRRR